MEIISEFLALYLPGFGVGIFLSCLPVMIGKVIGLAFRLACAKSR